MPPRIRLERPHAVRPRLRVAWAFALGMLVLSGCAERRRAQELGVSATGPRVDVYLNARGAQTEPVVLEIESVRLRDSSGGERELDVLRPLVSATAAERRIAIAGGEVTAGGYRALILRLRGAHVTRDGRRLDLRLVPPAGHEDPTIGPLPDPAVQIAQDYEVSVQVNLLERGAAAVFLDWNVADSLVGSAEFLPALAATLELPTSRLGLLYACDAANGSVLAVDRASGEVVGNGRVGAGPLALALGRDRRTLFVANGGDGSITVLDLQRIQADLTVPIRFGAGTCDLVLSADQRYLAAANPGLDSVTLLDATLATRLREIPVGRSPVRMCAAPGTRRLYVANSRSDDVSVIDLDAQAVVATPSVGQAPSAIASDRRGSEILVGHRLTPNVVVLDARSLQQVASVLVGTGVTAILSDRLRDRFYVARSNPPEILVVERRLSAVVRRIPITGPVTRLVQPPEGSLIFGSSPDSGGLVVVDVSLGVEKPLLPCGVRPSDVVVVE
ncbi:MAG: hypothetical protein NTY35_02285 [Planctomycetota bacterium]|nr:hypothetical protein [Planctomycetota bacterium]